MLVVVVLLLMRQALCSCGAVATLVELMLMVLIAAGLLMGQRNVLTVGVLLWRITTAFACRWRDGGRCAGRLVVLIVIESSVVAVPLYGELRLGLMRLWRSLDGVTVVVIRCADGVLIVRGVLLLLLLADLQCRWQLGQRCRRCGRFQSAMRLGPIVGDVLHRLQHVGQDVVQFAIAIFCGR